MHTLGCRLNRFESDGILSKFAAAGYEVVDFENAPDIAIVNTCTVTDQADSRNRNLIRRAVRANANTRVVVTGCFAQTDPDVVARIPGVAMVIGNDRKSSLFDLVEEYLAAEKVRRANAADQDESGTGAGNLLANVDPAALVSALPPVRPGTLPVLSRPFAYEEALPVGHTRAYIKVQDGCDRKCSYCKIPQARGRGVSRALSEIISHVSRLEENGVREIVVTGVNLGWYRDPESGARLPELLRRMLGSMRHSRLRLSSIEPPDVNAELAEISLHPLFCDFLHVPVQSGSGRVLRAMRRTYNPYSFRKRIETVLARNPEAFLGTDVIVGFPGETEEDFEQTVAMVTELGFANIHPFRFSPRAGTVAARMAGRPHPDVVRERIQTLLRIKSNGWQKYAVSQQDRKRRAIIESVADGFAWGLTDNFLRVRLAVLGEVERGASVDVRLGPTFEEGILHATLL